MALVPGPMSASCLAKIGGTQADVTALWSATKHVLTKVMGFKVSAGPPPPSAAERRVSEWVRRNNPKGRGKGEKGEKGEQ